MPNPGGAAISNLSGLLMYMYPDKTVHDQINNNTPTWNLFKRRGYPTNQGSQFQVNVLLAHSMASRHVPEWGTYPEAQKSTNAWAAFTFSKLVRTIRFSGEAKQYGGSIKDVMRNEVENAVTAIGNDLERNLWLTRRGEHATVVDCTNATTITASSYQYLEEGMVVDVVLLATGLPGAGGITGATITSITPNYDNGQATVVIDTAMADYTAVDTTYGIYLNGEYNGKCWGIPDVLRTTDPTYGAYGGIARASNRRWQANSWTLSAAISIRAVAAMATEIQIRSGKRPDLGIAHPYIVDDLIELARVNVREGARVDRHQIWGQVVYLPGITVIPCHMCPLGEFYLLNSMTWRHAYPNQIPSMGFWRKNSGTNSIISDMPNTWGFEGVYLFPRQLVCTSPISNGVLKSVTWSKTGSVAA